MRTNQTVWVVLLAILGPKYATASASGRRVRTRRELAAIGSTELRRIMGVNTQAIQVPLSHAETDYNISVARPRGDLLTTCEKVTALDEGICLAAVTPRGADRSVYLFRHGMFKWVYLGSNLPRGADLRLQSANGDFDRLDRVVKAGGGILEIDTTHLFDWVPIALGRSPGRLQSSLGELLQNLDQALDPGAKSL